MLDRATEAGWVTVKSSDKTWSTGGGNGNPLQYSYYKNFTEAMKRQKNTTSLPGHKTSNVQLGKSREQLLIFPERIKGLDQNGNDTELFMCLVVKVESDAVKNNTA